MSISFLFKHQASRYLFAGMWNTLVASLLFSGLWFLLNHHLPSLAIVAFAHFFATTNSFFVQRIWVFKSKEPRLLIQYGKFQLSYLSLFFIGSTFIEGLSSQGLHPIAAQLIGTVVLAVCGYIFGKSFTFKEGSMDIRSFFLRIKNLLVVHQFAFIFFILSLVFFEGFLAFPFYVNPDHVGHDFALTATHLLEGKFWIDSNGLMKGLFNPPWFTASWCAGAAFYADPQAAFYSPLQWFAFFFDPFVATHLSALLFVSLGYWGCYILARSILKWDTPASVVFAILAMINSFMPLRSAVGEAGFHAFYLWPFFITALSLNSFTHTFKAHFWPTISISVILTAWIQFGFGGLLIPGLLACAAFCFVLVLLGRASLKGGLLRLTLGSILAAGLNGSRLYENTSLLAQFPRNFYDLPGFSSVGDTLTAIGMSLFSPSEWTYTHVVPKMTHLTFTPYPHEWNYDFGLGSLVLIALGFVGATMLLWQSFSKKLPLFNGKSLSLIQTLSVLGLILVLSLPFILLLDLGSLRLLIKQIPILNSAAWPMRWILVYVPLMQLLIAASSIVIFRFLPKASKGFLLTAMFTLLWLGPITQPLGYYMGAEYQGYNPQMARETFTKSLASPAPKITRVEMPTDGQLYGNRNDVMMQGASQGACYNPIYGYRLESLPQKNRLGAGGNVLDFDNQYQTRIRNPACLIHPNENQCQPGDGFNVKDKQAIQNVKLFLDRKPIEWKRPTKGIMLSYVSQGIFWLLFSLCFMRIWQLFIYSLRQSDDDSVSK